MADAGAYHVFVQLVPMIQGTLAVVAAFALFGGFHSVLAQTAVREWLFRRLAPTGVRYWYRSAYSLASWLLLYKVTGLFFILCPAQFFKPLISLPTSVYLTVDVARLVGAVCAMWAFLQHDYLQFVGLKQLWNGLGRLLNIRSMNCEIKETGVDRFEVTGIYRYIRNPMMTGVLLGAIPTNVNLLAIEVYLSLAVYIYYGVKIEERKLVRLFGEAYVKYRCDTGAFFPRLRRI